ncbi:hypothetical protein ACFCYN_14215 [Gottfriedia sp. NPDC056225]|uniref:hypothetical protein n=1 Tax=Gottfriedia sp. NPDC056225 TaxID=3345751 RepID=UPI0035E007B4
MEKLKSTKGMDIYESWIEMDMQIMVGEPGVNTKMDRVILKKDSPNIGRSGHVVISDEIKDVKVELVKYYKG